MDATRKRSRKRFPATQPRQEGEMQEPSISNTPSTSNMPSTSNTPSTSNAPSTSNTTPTPNSVTGTAPMLSRAQCSVSIATAPNKSVKTFKQLNEEINNSMSELRTSEKDFVEKVTQLKATDRMVFQNAARLERLDKGLTKICKSQACVSSELNRIGGGLLWVEEAVRNLENLDAAKQPSSASRASTFCSDGDPKVHLYNFVAQMNSDLHHLTNCMSRVVEESNSYPRNPEVDTDPLSQIGGVLNNHYQCLLGIEVAHDKVKAALEEVQKKQMHKCFKCLQIACDELTH